MSKQEDSLYQMQTLRENLRFLRESHGWSREKLSAHSGIPTEVLAVMEEGEDFAMEHLLTLGRLYEKEPVEFFVPMKDREPPLS